MNRKAQTVGFVVVALTIAVMSGSAWSFYSTPEDEILGQVLMGAETLSAGTVVPSLPNGARSVIVERIQYFVSGYNWFLPIVNEDGVKYQVVFAPV